MGMVSINHYAGIELRPDSVQVKYLLDFAEIPSIVELDRADPDRDDRVTPEERDAYVAARSAEILPLLELEINGRRVELEPTWSRVTFPPGEGGLSTVRIAWDLRASLGPEPLTDQSFLLWSDKNYESRLGWKEIRIAGFDGIGIHKTSLPPAPSSGELSEYPEEYLYDPPTDTKAWCLFGPGEGSGEAEGFEPPPGFGGPRGRDRFANLVAREDLSPGVIAVSLLLAIVLGAAHALEPGHGKTVVAAYLVGSRGTPLQAVLLGLTVTLTHTFSVFLLGLAALYLSRYFVPEQMFPVLGAVSGVLISAVGIWMLRDRLRSLRTPRLAPHEHEPGEGHAHDHGHEHDHTHVPAGRASLASILALGVSGGLVPCPAGIVVLLSAISLGRIVFGLLLIAAFSVGLAAVLIAVGLLFVSARHLFTRFPAGRALADRIGVASACVITLFGIVLAVRALAGAGFISG